MSIKLGIEFSWPSQNIWTLEKTSFQSKIYWLNDNFHLFFRCQCNFSWDMTMRSRSRSRMHLWIFFCKCFNVSKQNIVFFPFVTSILVVSFLDKDGLISESFPFWPYRGRDLAAFLVIWAKVKNFLRLSHL